MSVRELITYPGIPNVLFVWSIVALLGFSFTAGKVEYQVLRISSNNGRSNACFLLDTYRTRRLWITT